MFSRGLAFCLCVSMTSMAHAGAVVTLVPLTPGPYDPLQIVDVDVMLAQSPAGTARELRHVQLDFAASASELTLIQSITHSLGANTVRFFDFLGEPDCPASDNAGCGAGHFYDFSFTSPPDRQRVVSMTYYFVSAANLKANPGTQRTLPASAAIRIGRMQVRMPDDDTPACYTLDALNATQTNPDLGGADIRFGFGTDVVPDGVALTTWRANLAAPNNITGSSIQMCVGSGGGDPCTLVSALPANNQSLWRQSRNIAILTFDCPGGSLPTPSSGDVSVKQLLNAGAFGAELGGSFTFTVNGNTLEVRDSATTLVHRNWYGIRNATWAGVAPFSVDYVVQVGDANNDGRVLFADLAFINAAIPTDPALETNRRDINADGRVLFNDLASTNARIPSDTVTKPTGH